MKSSTRSKLSVWETKWSTLPRALWPLGKLPQWNIMQDALVTNITLSLHVEHPSGTYKWHTQTNICKNRWLRKTMQMILKEYLCIKESKGFLGYKPSLYYLWFYNIEEEWNLSKTQPKLCIPQSCQTHFFLFIELSPLWIPTRGMIKYSTIYSLMHWNNNELWKRRGNLPLGIWWVFSIRKPNTVIHHGTKSDHCSTI